jgi:hypothetical protein
MSPLASWNDAVDAAPRTSRAAIGRWLLWLGGGAMLAGLFLTPPWGKIGVAVAVLGWLLARPPGTSRLVAALGWALLLWIGLGVAVSDAAPRLDGTAYAWLAIPLTAAAAVDARWRRWVLPLVVSIGVAAAVVAALQFSIGLGSGPLRIDPDGKRLSVSRGFSAYHLAFGFAASVLACLAIPAAMPRAWRWAGRIAALAGLLLCGARGCLVGGLAAIGATLAVRDRRWLLGAIGLVALLAALFAARMALTEPGRLQRMLAGQDGRWPIWQTSLAMVRDDPWFGAGGRDAYKAAYNAVYQREAIAIPNEFLAVGGAAHAHNWLLALAAERGVPAALLHLAVVLAVLHLLWTRRRERPEAWQMGCGLVAAALVAGMFEPLPAQAAVGMGFHAALGVAVGLAHRRPVPGA